MAFADFLNDRCDIYHLQTKDVDAGYGVTASACSDYPDEPDVSDVPCHFNRGGLIDSIIEASPRRLYSATSKLQLPLGTDVRANDKIVDSESGLEFVASVPRVVGRGHHIAVVVSRLETEEL